MTLTLDIAPDIETRLLDMAERNGQTPEETVATALRRIFSADKDYCLSDEADDNGALARSVFTANANLTCSVWDNPDEDAAWTHLQ